MSTPQKNKGPWTHQALIYFFTLLFGVLVFWLLGFVVRDIATWPGPNYAEVEKGILDPQLTQGLEELRARLSDTNRVIQEQRQRQTTLRDSAVNSERTMNQLLELQRLAMQKGVHPTLDEQQALAESEKRFLASQAKYEEINDRIAALSDRVREMEEQQRARQQQLEDQRGPVRVRFESLYTAHQLKLAAWKLACLLPLLAVAIWLFLKRRTGIYASLVYGFGIPVLLKVGLVMHEHFPRRYFKYVLIVAALAVVVRALIYLLRAAAFPKPDWLLKQYREAYERFLCPVCSHPIRRGPLRYVSWNQRKPVRLVMTAEAAASPEEPYTCPVCATPLFETCDRCHAVRHSLLPACSHCGARQDQEVAPAPDR